MNRDYLVEIKGNEALLERYIKAIEEGNCKVSKEYPRPYVLDTGEKFLDTKVVEYFMTTRMVNAETYSKFLEKVRLLYPESFSSYSYTVKKWIEYRVKDVRTSLKQGISFQEGYIEELSDFICYMAICHVKYGASYEVVTAEKYFDYASELGSKKVAKLKKEGTGTLPKELQSYKDEEIMFKVNDVFATIKIKLYNDTQKAYENALRKIIALLKTNFPKSYSMSFATKTKKSISIKGLPKCPQNHFFAGAIFYPDLNPLVEEYAKLAMKKHEWYNNLEDEKCAMPSTFAVFGLAIENDHYFGLASDYFKTVDDEHQGIQSKFTPAFIEKYGVSEKSIKVIVGAILSMQEHPALKKYQSLFLTEKALKLLLDCKKNYVSYFLSQEDLEDAEENSYNLDELGQLAFSNVLYCLFGDAKSYVNIKKKLDTKEAALFAELVEEK